jgi:hypothetical protein
MKCLVINDNGKIKPVSGIYLNSTFGGIPENQTAGIACNMITAVNCIDGSSYDGETLGATGGVNLQVTELGN